MSNVEKSDELKLKATEAYKNKNFEEAEKLYREAYELNDKNLLLLNNIAAVLIEKNELDEALKVTDEALERRYALLAPYEHVAKIFNRKASIYLKKNMYPEAIEMYKKSLTEVQDRKTRTLLRETERMYEKKKAEEFIDPVKAEEHRVKGNEYFKEKNYPAAKVEYDLAIKRNPKDEKLYSNRAAALMCLFEFPTAIKDCEKAIEINPGFVKAHSRMGTCYFRMKDYNNAKKAYKKGLDYDSGNKECLSGLEAVNTAIYSQMNEEPNEENVKKAMNDPEIQSIISDPQMQIILKQLSENPNKFMQYMSDPKIANAIEKLIGAGILRMGAKNPNDNA